MARANITGQQRDLVEDEGAILLSLIQGEQIELPIEIDFLEKADGKSYIFEAVIVEGNNDGTGEAPEAILNGGDQQTLTIRLCTYRGAWAGEIAYNAEEYVAHNDTYYRLMEGASRINALSPDNDPDFWEEFEPSNVFVQFPKTLSVTPAWATQPTVNKPVYGFFELSVTEPVGVTYQRTWKPIRGMVEIRFSPTEMVS